MVTDLTYIALHLQSIRFRITRNSWRNVSPIPVVAGGPCTRDYIKVKV